MNVHAHFPADVVLSRKKIVRGPLIIYCTIMVTYKPNTCIALQVLGKKKNRITEFNKLKNSRTITSTPHADGATFHWLILE